MEHWLPLFHERLETLFDYLPDAPSSASIRSVDDARAKRLEQITDHYDARAQALERKAFGAPPYQSRAAREHVPERGRLAEGARRAAR